MGPVDFDSVGYLDFAPQRTSIYPTFLDMVSTLPNPISFSLFIQSAIYVVTTFVLLRCFLIHLKSVFMTTTLVGFGLALNLYLQAFHTIILTESLCFSLMNLLVALLVKVNFGKKTIEYQCFITWDCLWFAYRFASSNDNCFAVDCASYGVVMSEQWHFICK